MMLGGRISGDRVRAQSGVETVPCSVNSMSLTANNVHMLFADAHARIQCC